MKILKKIGVGAGGVQGCECGRFLGVCGRVQDCGCGRDSGVWVRRGPGLWVRGVGVQGCGCGRGSGVQEVCGCGRGSGVQEGFRGVGFRGVGRVQECGCGRGSGLWVWEGFRGCGRGSGLWVRGVGAGGVQGCRRGVGVGGVQGCRSGVGAGGIQGCMWVLRVWLKGAGTPPPTHTHTQWQLTQWECMYIATLQSRLDSRDGVIMHHKHTEPPRPHD